MRTRCYAAWLHALFSPHSFIGLLPPYPAIASRRVHTRRAFFLQSFVASRHLCPLKGQWLPTLALLCEIPGVKLELSIRYSILTSACEKGQ